MIIQEWVDGVPMEEIEKRNQAFLDAANEMYSSDDEDWFTDVYGDDRYDEEEEEDCDLDGEDGGGGGGGGYSGKSDDDGLRDFLDELKDAERHYALMVEGIQETLGIDAREADFLASRNILWPCEVRQQTYTSYIVLQYCPSIATG